MSTSDSHVRRSLPKTHQNDLYNSLTIRSCTIHILGQSGSIYMFVFGMISMYVTFHKTDHLPYRLLVACALCALCARFSSRAPLAGPVLLTAFISPWEAGIFQKFEHGKQRCKYCTWSPHKVMITVLYYVHGNQVWLEEIASSHSLDESKAIPEVNNWKLSWMKQAPLEE